MFVMGQFFNVLYIRTASSHSVIKFCYTCDDFAPIINFNQLNSDLLNQNLDICDKYVPIICTCVTKKAQYLSDELAQINTTRKHKS